MEKTNATKTSDKKDITIKCKDCGKEFVWTAGEQDFFESIGLTNQPVRCKDCRKAKAERNNRDRG